MVPPLFKKSSTLSVFNSFALPAILLYRLSTAALHRFATRLFFAFAHFAISNPSFAIDGLFKHATCHKYGTHPASTTLGMFFEDAPVIVAHHNDMSMGDGASFCLGVRLGLCFKNLYSRFHDSLLLVYGGVIAIVELIFIRFLCLCQEKNKGIVNYFCEAA